LEGPSVAPKAGFEKPREIKLPKNFEHQGEQFKFGSRDYPNGKLVLRTSDTPLARSGELAALNTIDILGEIGCIGSYRMNELGFLRNAPESEFIYGECQCPMLEDPKINVVSNDREKLVGSELTFALLEWIRQQVDSLAGEMADKQRNQKESRDLQQASLFNQILDRWKNKFMAQLTADLFGGNDLGVSFGGSGGGGKGPGQSEIEGGNKGGAESENEGSLKGSGGGDEEDGQGGGAGDEKRRGTRFPKVLLSGRDLDPLDELATQPFTIDARQPPVYQRFEDIEHGIYWINTARPLAKKIISRFGADSMECRQYLFQRYVDIIFKQAVFHLARHDPEFTPDKVDNLINDVTIRVHDAAADDLETFLFDKHMTGIAPPSRHGTSQSHKDGA